MEEPRFSIARTSTNGKSTAEYFQKFTILFDNLFNHLPVLPSIGQTEDGLLSALAIGYQSCRGLLSTEQATQTLWAKIVTAI